MKRIDNMSPEDLEEALVGQQIVAVNESNGTIVLANGTELEFSDNYACCAWFNYELTALATSDNAITKVDLVEGDTNSDDNDELSWKVNILSYDTPVATLEVDGNVGTGWYGDSIELIIRQGRSRDS